MSVLLFQSTEALGAAAVTIDGSQTYQVIDGFGVNANHRGWNNTELEPVLDALIDQGGMTLFRIIYDLTDWETGNDNNDPMVLNWSYYNTVYSSADFEAMWGLAGYLNQKGITNGLAFNFQGTGPSWMMNGAYLNSGYEAEWAETVGSVLVYARNNRHLQFSLAAPGNEPDNSADPRHQGVLMTTGQYVTAMRDLAQLLDTNGLGDVRFVAPDLANTSTTWLSAMMADPVLMSKVGHFGLHSYQDNGGGSTGVYSFLQQSAYPDRTFWMTEFNVWCSSCENCGGGDNSWSAARGLASYLLYHLANGASAGLIWEGYDSYYRLGNCWSYWGLIGVDNINAVPKTYTPRKGFYTMSQLSKFVRPGARRIGLNGATSPLNVLAFLHSGTGQLTIAGVNPSTSAVVLSGTLANVPSLSTLDLYYTSSSANLFRSGSVPVSGGVFSVTLPPDCVFTLVGSPLVSVVVTNPPDGSSYSAPATIAIQASASTSAGTISLVEFFNGTNKLGQDDVAPYALTWSNVPPGSYALTARACNSLGFTGVSPVVNATVIGPLAQIRVDPANVTVQPYVTQQFSATATDALGSNLNPQPTLAWSVSGGGAIGTNGLFSAGGVPGGPFTVSASSGGVNGTARVSIASTGKPFLPAQTNWAINELSLLRVTNTAIASSFTSQLVTNTFYFNYTGRTALLADGWNFSATLPGGASRNTEVTSGAVVSYDQGAHPGVLRIPCDAGDLWDADNNTQNSLFRNLPTNWISLQLALSFAPTTYYQQAHLGLYQNDDNYLQAGVAYNASSPAGRGMTMDIEVNGSPNAFAKVPASVGDFYLRLERSLTNSVITGLGSLDGTNWTILAATNQSLINPRLAIWTGGSPGGLPNCDLHRLDMVVSNSVPTALSYALLTGPPGASVDTNGVISWMPSEEQGSGTNVITTVVSDNGMPPSSATNSFTVVVNEVNGAPVLPVAADVRIAGRQTLVVTNTAADGDIPANGLSYWLLTSPTGAAIDTYGVITWVPGVAQVPSTNVFETMVSDWNPWAVNAQQMSATNRFTVVVDAVHNGPVLSPQADVTVAELTTLTVTNAATDTDLPVLGLNYSLLDAPAGASVDTNGVISWTPSEEQGPGTNVITTVISDNGVPPSSATNRFTVVVNEINVVPVLPVRADVSIVGRQTLVVTNTATDGDIPANSLSYLLLTAPTGASIDTNGVITWVPAVEQVPSTNVFETVVSDWNPWAVNAQQLSTTNRFTVVVDAVHNGPVLPPQADMTVAELTTLTVTNAATDTDLPVLGLNYTLLDAPAGVSIDTNGVISWTPSEEQGPGTNVITTLVADDGVPPFSATNSFTVVVNEINVAPVLPVRADVSIAGRQTLVVTNTAADGDIPANSLSYLLLTSPTGAAIDADGVITWVPAVEQVPSTNVFETVVSDWNPWAVNRQQLSATNSFLVLVMASREGLVPVIEGITLSNGVITVSWSALDGWRYRLQYMDSLSETNWLDVQPDMIATGPSASLTDNVGGGAGRFYRVVVR